jgi:broad specificity phosphatase PhoE
MQHSEQRFLIMRHGETEANATGRIQGSTNTSSNLTEMGKQQAIDAGNRLAKMIMENDHRNRHQIIIHHVYISPLSRARETLEYLRGGASMSGGGGEGCIIPEDDEDAVTVNPDLTGIPLYDWEGQSIDELRERDPDVYRAWIQGDAQSFHIAGHAPVSEVWERAARLWPTVLRTRTNKHNDDTLPTSTTLIVCHGTLSQALLATAFGWDESVFRKHDFPNAGMVELIWRTDEPRARCWRWLYPQLTEWIYPESGAVVNKDGCE